MLSIILNHKVFLFWSIVILILCSITITLSSDNTLSDSLSITFSLFAGCALFFTTVILLEEMVYEICNP
jgi:O-antigen ligase